LIDAPAGEGQEVIRFIDAGGFTADAPGRVERLAPGCICHADPGDEHVAHPAPAARILVIEREGSTLHRSTPLPRHRRRARIGGPYPDGGDRHGCSSRLDRLWLGDASFAGRCRVPLLGMAPRPWANSRRRDLALHQAGEAGYPFRGLGLHGGTDLRPKFWEVQVALETGAPPDSTATW
jgi:hypothetical protein